MCKFLPNLATLPITPFHPYLGAPMNLLSIWFNLQLQIPRQSEEIKCFKDEIKGLRGDILIRMPAAGVWTPLFKNMGRTRSLFVYFCPFHLLDAMSNLLQNLTIKAYMVCLGFKPGTGLQVVLRKQIHWAMTAP